jgi:hypothetical protein
LKPSTSLWRLERHEEVINADVLDAWFDPSPRVLERLREFLPFLVRTSPPVAARRLGAIAQARGIPEESILTGSGSSDLIFRSSALPLKDALSSIHLWENTDTAQNVLDSPSPHSLFTGALLSVDTARFIADVNTRKPSVVPS